MEHKSHDVRVYRLLDAAANRAGEGLRVVEDYVRFVLDDLHLTEAWKTLRHDLTAVLAEIPWPVRCTARQTQHDVGTGLSTEAEKSRGDAAAVVTANAVRVQQALRSLEEFAKLLDSDLAARFEALRYRSYTLAAAVETTHNSLERLDALRLYVLTDGRESVEVFESLITDLVTAGIDAIQLRDKQLGDRELLDRARRLRQMTQGTSTLFIMNDRADLAAVALADGVHVGQDELSVRDARAVVGPQSLVGVSTHSIEQARQAVLDGANYIGVGPTFPSQTKQFDEFGGIELLRQVAAEIRLPAFAIGGIDVTNLPAVLATGIKRIAVSAAIAGAADPTIAARRFLTAVSESSNATRRVSEGSQNPVQ
jgi:thiamine-phosphate pyrophosphorylase